MRKIVLDLETISDIDLKKCGARVYAASPHTRITVLSFYDFETKKQYTIHDEAVALKKNDLSEEDKCVIEDVFTRLDTLVIAHNAAFEQVVMNNCLEQFLVSNARLGSGLSFNMSNLTYFCTQTWANVFRSPASLENAAKFFDVEIQKDAKGASLMKKICSPMKEGCNEGSILGLPYMRVDIDGKPFKGGWDVYDRMRQYCEQDVRATIKLFAHLQKMTGDLGGFLEATKAGAALTAKMNSRGVGVNTELLPALEAARDIIYDRADAAAARAFGVPSASMNTRIKKAILEKTGYEVDSLGKHEIKQLVKSGKIKDKQLIADLEEFAKYNMASLKKITKARDSMVDGKLYDMFKYCGAYATGRWSSFGMQLQNLPRSSTEKFDAMAIAAGCTVPETVLANPEVFQDGIRALIKPDKEGDKFYIADLKGIEARVALYLSGYNGIVDKMHNEGYDLYVKMASVMYGEDRGKEMRQVGKNTHLGCQYGQGANGFKSYAAKMGSDITEEESKLAVSAFRKTYPKMVTKWKVFDNQVKRSFIKKEPLRVTLSTGRVLDFGILEMIEKKCKFTGKMRKNLHYKAGDKWSPIYGSKVFQNVVQAEARDLLLLKMIEMDRMGYDIRMTIHDEVVIQVQKDSDKVRLDAVWRDAGAEEIDKYWKGLLVASDSVILDHYWSH